MVDMTGKIVIVTGGNSGIGYISCQKLLEKNAKVYMAARNSQKTTDALKRLKEETGRDIAHLPIDLADLHTVRIAAEQFLRQENRLDVLLNNAGVMATPYKQLTKDGYDMQFGVNVLAHFHFTTLLLDALLAAPEPRVVNVSSVAHNMAFGKGIYFDTLKGSKKSTWIPGIELERRYQAYSQSKLGNILFSNELARRYGDKGLVSIALHPGFIDTALTRNHAQWFQSLTAKIYSPPLTGAVTQLYAANAPEAKVFSGKYLVPLAHEGKTSANGQNQTLAVHMWDWCENELKSF